jgi:putative membrane protein
LDYFKRNLFIDFSLNLTATLPSNLPLIFMNKDLILREKLALQRTILANQSTFLSFIRTSMYFLVAGISVNNLTTIPNKEAVELLLIGVAIVVFGIGLINFLSNSKKIKESEKHIGDFKDEYLK